MITKEDTEILKKYEESFNQVKHNYMRGLIRSELHELVTVAEKYGIILKSKGCSKCVLTFMQQLSAYYFENRYVETEKDTPEKLLDTPEKLLDTPEKLLDTPENKSKKNNGRKPKKCTDGD